MSPPSTLPGRSRLRPARRLGLCVVLGLVVLSAAPGAALGQVAVPHGAFPTHVEPSFVAGPPGGAELPPAGVPPVGPAAETVESRLLELEQELERLRQADAASQAATSERFTLVPFGRLHSDLVAVNQDAANEAIVGAAQNGVDIRRARLGVMGEGFEIFAYRLDVDFVTTDQQTGQRPTLFDAYLDVTHLPLVGNLRAGHFREPFSLQRLESSNDYMFMERANSVNTLAPFRNMGVMLFNSLLDRRATWSTGLFAENSNEFGEQMGDHGGQAFTTRLTCLPWYDEPAQGRYLVHLGVSHSYRRPTDLTRRFSATPEVVLHEGSTSFPKFVDTGTIPYNAAQVYGAEALVEWGPFSLQSEYVGMWIDQPQATGTYLHGAYLEGVWSLTGEKRVYVRELGIRQQAVPYSNFFLIDTLRGLCCGRGAWELGARYSWIDLNTADIAGGDLQDLSLGLNWYLAVRTRWMLNYTHAILDRDQVTSQADIVSTRLQFNF